MMTSATSLASVASRLGSSSRVLTAALATLQLRLASTSCR